MSEYAPKRSPDEAGSYRICRRELRSPDPNSQCGVTLIKMAERRARRDNGRDTRSRKTMDSPFPAFST